MQAKNRRKSTVSSSNPWMIALSLLGLVLFLALVWAGNNFDRILRFKRNITHLIHHDAPEGYKIHGIDVSRYQGRIEWRELTLNRIKGQPIHFVFIKSTEGIKLKDTHFDKNWKQASRAGLYRGAYHYFKPKADPRKQAFFFIRNTPISKGDLPPVLDFEEDGNLPEKELRSRLIIWLKLVEKHYKVKPILYCNAGYYKKYIKGKLEGYPIWVAHYKTRKPRINKDAWHFWQYTDKGKIKGIKGHVDMNVFNGTHEDFNKLLVFR